SDANHFFVPDPTSNFIPNATSRVFNGTNSGDATATLTRSANTAHQEFYSDVLANFVEGNGINGIAGYKFDGLFSRLYNPNDPNTLVEQLSSNVVHVMPGIELVNTIAANNGGNITVSSNWNLAAGTANNLQNGTYVDNTGKSLGNFMYFDPATSYVNFTYRLATPWGGFDPGALTLRTAGTINVNASISDGFFQFGNYLDTTYNAALQSALRASLTSVRGVDWLQNFVGGSTEYLYYLNGFKTPLAAPYNAAGTLVSPSSTDLIDADLFPNALLVCAANCTTPTPVTNPGSWSYGIVAGADVTSANPNAVTSLASALKANTGNVIVANHQTYAQP